MRSTINLRVGILFAAALLSVTTAVAQESYWGVRGGVSIPRLSGGGDNELTRDYKSRTATTFGGFVDIGLRKKTSIQIEIDYAGHGGKRKGMQPIPRPIAGLPVLPVGQYYYAAFENEAKLSYWEVPVVFKYRLHNGTRRAFFLDGGGFYGRLASAHTITSGLSPVYLDKGGAVRLSPQAVSFDATTNVKSDLRPNNWGLAGGGGVEFRRSRDRFIVEGRVSYGLTPIQRDTVLNGRSHTGNLTIAFAYAFHLGR